MSIVRERKRGGAFEPLTARQKIGDGIGEPEGILSRDELAKRREIERSHEPGVDTPKGVETGEVRFRRKYKL